MLTDQDLYLFNEGSHFQLYDKLGAHPFIEGGEVAGTSFAVWAPNAREVRADRFGFCHEMPPRTGSVVWDLEYTWQDQAWMEGRYRNNRLDGPINIYEMHFGSWRPAPGEHRSLSYREMAEPLTEHLQR